MYKYNFLQGKIKENCGTQEKYAKLLGISVTELGKKLANKASFTQSQIDSSIKILNLQSDEVAKAFFTHE